MRSRSSENCLKGMRTLQGTHILNIVILLLTVRENLTLKKNLNFFFRWSLNHENEVKDIGHVTDGNFVTLGIFIQSMKYPGLSPSKI